MSAIPSPQNAAEALQMLRAGMGYLAAADATAMAAGEQARCLQAMELIQAMGTAARTGILGAFIAGQGYQEDACYGAKSWLTNHLGVTKGAATAYLRWARRAGAHPRVPGPDQGLAQPQPARPSRVTSPARQFRWRN